MDEERASTGMIHQPRQERRGNGGTVKTAERVSRVGFRRLDIRQGLINMASWNSRGRKNQPSCLALPAEEGRLSPPNVASDR